MTFKSPFLSTGNGYFGAIGGILFSLRLLQTTDLWKGISEKMGAAGALFVPPCSSSCLAVARCIHFSFFILRSRRPQRRERMGSWASAASFSPPLTLLGF
jgi:hypothetical protein